MLYVLVVIKLSKQKEFILRSMRSFPWDPGPRGAGALIRYIPELAYPSGEYIPSRFCTLSLGLYHRASLKAALGCDITP